ncbi:MAG: WD40 repeat domain-containing protein [Methanoculleus sp.]|nr:WD40 repeat domain-containing protein [Methanoculleus sp.]
MSSGEMSSINSNLEEGVGSGEVRVMQPGRRGRELAVYRPLSLFLFFCLIIVLCGPVAASEKTYTPLWNRGACGAVSSVDISQDGAVIVTGSDSTVYLLDQGGELLWEATVGSRINGVGISPEGSHIGVAADKLYLFDRDGKLLWTEKTTFVYHSVALSSRAAYVTAGCDNGAVYIFDTNKRALWDYDMGTSSYDIAISENGRVTVAGCKNSGVYYLNSREGESWSYGTGKSVKGIALTPDGRFVAAGSIDRCVYLSTGQGEHLWKYPTENAVISTALTNEAREIFAASGMSVHILDRSGTEIQRITLNGRAESVAVTPDGSFLVIGGGDGDRSIHLLTSDEALIHEEGTPEPEKTVASGTEPQGRPAGNVTQLDNSTTTPTGANSQPSEGGGSVTAQVRGWLENIFALLFRPQEDFLA